MSIQTKVITAKALRTAFNNTQSELLKQSYMDDEHLTKQVREMQEQYKVFKALVEEIKAEDEDVYEKQILGIGA